VLKAAHILYLFSQDVPDCDLAQTLASKNLFQL